MAVTEASGARLQLAYLDRPVSDIADVADEVGAELVDPRHHGCRPPRAIDRPVVRVGDHRDAQSIHAGPEPRDSDIDFLDARHPHRFGVTPYEENRDHTEHGSGDQSGPHRIIDPRGQQGQVQ